MKLNIDVQLLLLLSQRLAIKSLKLLIEVFELSIKIIPFLTELSSKLSNFVIEILIERIDIHNNFSLVIEFGNREISITIH